MARKEKEFLEKLDHKNSYWKMEDGRLIRLNDTPINTDNVYIVFWCVSCDGDDETGYHAVSYKKLKVDQDGDYVACCPNDEVFYQSYLSADSVPAELEELFLETEFEEYNQEIDQVGETIEPDPEWNKEDMNF